MENLLEVFKAIGAVASTVVSVAAAGALLIKPIRERIFAGTKAAEAEREGIKCLLRDAVLAIYFEGRDTKTMDEFVFESLVLKYKAYKALGGNSFIDKLYKEMTETWEIVHRTGV